MMAQPPGHALPPEGTLGPLEGPLLKMFYDFVVASSIFYCVVCCSSNTKGERKKLDMLIKKSSLVLGCHLDSVQVVGNRMTLVKLTTMLDHESPPLAG